MEHAAWAADHQLVGVASTHIWTLAIVLWGIPLLVNLVRKLRQLGAHMHHQSVPTPSDSATKKTIKSSQQCWLMLDVIQTLCDLVIAIFWMPSGFLWGGKLPALWWGLFGTVSSLIGLYKTIACP